MTWIDKSNLTSGPLSKTIACIMWYITEYFQICYFFPIPDTDIPIFILQPRIYCIRISLPKVRSHISGVWSNYYLNSAPQIPNCCTIFTIAPKNWSVVRHIKIKLPEAKDKKQPWNLWGGKMTHYYIEKINMNCHDCLIKKYLGQDE